MKPGLYQIHYKDAKINRAGAAILNDGEISGFSLDGNLWAGKYDGRDISATASTAKRAGSLAELMSIPPGEPLPPGATFEFSLQSEDGGTASIHTGNGELKIAMHFVCGIPGL